MSCLWCQDEELGTQTLQLVLKWQDLKDQGENFRRAIQDFYSCSDCINAYHAVKRQFITNRNELTVYNVY